jgi:THO complex subunit 1
MILQSLREHEEDASLVASHILGHLTVVSKSSTPTSPLPQSSPAQSRFDGVLLANAVLSAVLYLSAEARERKVGLMEMSLLGKQSGYGSLALLVDSAICLASQSPPALDMGIPASCIEIAVNAATNAEIKKLLDYVDSRLANFQQNPAIMRRSHHTLLRTCTTLLKRLSKSQDALLCGRVFIFLAKFLPLTEKSGLNLTGAFHTENVTPLESDLEGKVDAEGNPIDAGFYAEFWGLQKWFANPPSVLASSAWQELSTALTTVLEKFDATKVTVTEGNRDGLMFAPAKSPLDVSNGNSNSISTPSVKYLTSARLLPLQLQDATFRRQILIQCLILLGWVERPFLKDWAEKAPTGEALEEVKQLQTRVLSMLEATPEQGKKFTEAIREIVFKSEFSWVVWKQAGCPEDPLHRVSPPAGFEQAASMAGSLPASYPPPKRARTSSEAVYNIRMGTEPLDRLWNVTEDNVSMLSAEDRGGFRSVRQLLEPVIDEILEAQDNKNEDKDGDLFSAASSDEIYSWKTLRMVARDSLPAFVTTVKKGGDLSVAARELYPDELPPLNPVPTKSGTEQKEVTTDLLHGLGWKGGETTAPSEMPSGDYVEQGTTDVTGGERREGRLAMSADGDGDGDGMVAADISTLPKEDS